MCILALIFSTFGCCGLLLSINAAVYHFMPVTGGLEGGFIDLAFGFVFGGASSLIALAFAVVHFFRAPDAKGARLTLAWCGFVTLGFVLVLVCMVMGHHGAHAA